MTALLAIVMPAAAASAVYVLLGEDGLGTTDLPPVETGLMDGALAIRQHAARYTDQPNWLVFPAFAAEHRANPDAPR